jgi:hypothetical protein
VWEGGVSECGRVVWVSEEEWSEDGSEECVGGRGEEGEERREEEERRRGEEEGGEEKGGEERRGEERKSRR